VDVSRIEREAGCEDNNDRDGEDDKKDGWEEIEERGPLTSAHEVFAFTSKPSSST
jgi:hypothetical protein